MPGTTAKPTPAPAAPVADMERGAPVVKLTVIFRDRTGAEIDRQTLTPDVTLAEGEIRATVSVDHMVRQN